MKEFMFLIRNEVNAKDAMSPNEHQQFLKACEVYIERLTKNGNLKSAQPMQREGKMISGTPGAFHEGPYSSSSEIIVGYYHILARDLDEATAIAQENPEFAFVKGAEIEVRLLKTIEPATGYQYPGLAQK
jgi:hypothetical protein